MLTKIIRASSQLEKVDEIGEKEEEVKTEDKGESVKEEVRR